ncbi:MAG: putative ABC transporter permease protein [Syntrophorhabdus sp. PtaU1.Bin050]|nr:MAG: putative ABC transporter permease protein [Syntrophorhabdus sp. PtaU1.Bin050]
MITKRERIKVTALVLVILPIAVCFVSICFGRYAISPEMGLNILISRIFPFEPTWSGIEELVVLKIRLPRVLLAMIVGSGLAVAGASFQGLFRNPLVSSDILGVSSGAGFGACLGILLSGKTIVVQSLAFAFGIIAVMGTYGASRRRTGTSLLILVLVGVIIGSFFSALIGLVKYVADPEDQLPTIVYWLMGSMAGASYKDLAWGAPPIILGTSVLLLLRWKINILSLGEEEAQSLGINTKWFKGVVILAATIITAASVSLCGIIGWIGLVIPHITRMLVGPNHKHLLPACVSVGGLSLLVIDDMARVAMAGEIPLSILTAIIGAPFFIYLLRKTGGAWS